MPIPRFPGHEEKRLQKIDDAKLLRQHQNAEEEDMNDPNLKYAMGKILGEGSFGKVYEAMNCQTGEMVAIKLIQLKASRLQQQLKMAHDELLLMRKLRHPNVVSVKGSSHDGNNFYIMMELVAGRSLFDMLQTVGKFHESVTRKFTKQLLNALEYCHKLHCVHRDIKGKNILLTTNGQLRLCDFGSAKIREETIDKDAVSVTYSYTPLWVAPETLTAKVYNEKVDIWALVRKGCVVIEMASGKDPWSEMNFPTAYAAIFHIGTSGGIPRIPSSLSPEGQDFLRKCLTRDPDRRPSASELLKHPFIAGYEADLSGSSTNSSPVSSLNGSAAAQMAQLAVMVDTRVKTMEIATSIAPNAAQVIVTGKQQHDPPPPPPPEDEIPPPPPAEDAVPPPPPPPYPFAHNDAGQAMAPPLASTYGNQFNMVYSFGTMSMAGNGQPAHGQVPAQFESDTVLLRSGSRIFQYEPSLTASSGGSSSASSSMGLTSSVLSFVDGHSLNLQPEQI